MVDTQIGNAGAAYALIVVAIGIVVAAMTTIARRRAIALFVSPSLRDPIFRRRGASFWSTLLVPLCLGLLVIALVDIRWGRMWRDVPQRGIEVMFALDVSRSMLAEDASPNRLTRAKQQIEDMIAAMPGDRVGLVAFAGDAKAICPMTNHYDEFRKMLDQANPTSVRRGGSRLGTAMETAAEGFLKKTNSQKTIVVFTDGEDQESDPLGVAKRLHDEQGIRVITVGLGDRVQGARIPDEQSREGGYVNYRGEQVWSKMDGQTLESIATQTGGAYIPAGTRRVDMASVYRRYVATGESTEFETAKINAYIPRYLWFAIPALALLMIECVVSTRRPPAGTDAGTSGL